MIAAEIVVRWGGGETRYELGEAATRRQAKRLVTRENLDRALLKWPPRYSTAVGEVWIGGREWVWGGAYLDELAAAQPTVGERGVW